MMKKIARLAAITVFMCCLLNGISPNSTLALENSSEWPFQVGERIVYTIKKFGVKVGEAVMEYKGPTTINDQEALYICFTAKALNFYDQENIYVDPETFLPIIIKRDLKIWGSNELIDQVYDHEAGTVTITKNENDKTTEEVISRSGPIYSIYGFIFWYRLNGLFNPGEEFSLTFPTNDLVMHSSEDEAMKTSIGELPAIILTSKPKNIAIWFDKREQRIPLKIAGSLGFGKTVMAIKEYVAQ